MAMAQVDTTVSARLVAGFGGSRVPAERLNVFGEWISDESEYQPPPCRSIAITDEMRALDAADRARREAPASSAWAIKAELSEENLRRGGTRLMRWAVVDERLQVTPARAIVVPAAKPAKTCKQCLAVLGSQYKSDLCTACLPMSERRAAAQRKQRIAVGKVKRYCKCGARISNASKLDVCGACRNAEVAPIRPVCVVEGCGTRLKSSLTGRTNGRCARCSGAELQRARRDRNGMAATRAVCVGDGCDNVLRPGRLQRADKLCRACAKKKWNAEQAERRRAARPACSGEGCERSIGGGNRARPDGLCAQCGARKDRHADMLARGGKPRSDGRQGDVLVQCSRCPAQIKARVKTGMCRLCLRASSKTRTLLVAKSADEFRADRAWAGLSADDKWIVFSFVTGQKQEEATR